MLPFERQQQLLIWLKQEGPLSITEISKRLNVSEMTVYRDIKVLMEDRKVVKTSGGVSLAETKQGSSTACTYCLKESNTRHSVQIITHDLKIEQQCCPHCGLMRYSDIEKDVSQIICRDFLSDTTISAKMAFYVIDSDFNLNCCQPQVLAFGSLKHAEQFQRGFGGALLPFDKAIKEIKQRMNGQKGCGCHK
ncbi:DeoR family transcriptional regulator [Bacillus sp. JJ1764]|uniref:DeoR family transcriptional regulator n=1 Tax=Bacillus sp. JJ1764 TaxID=3122964 RepID=UPI002FFF25C8